MKDNFEYAIKFVLGNEGGYINDLCDKGGETKYGISKASYPSVNIKTLTLEEAKDIYRRDYWKTTRLDLGLIEDPKIAAKMLDIIVNIGAYYGCLILLRALKRMSANFAKCNAGAVEYINNCDVAKLLSNLQIELTIYYKRLVVNKPSMSKFLKGWLNRAAKMP